MAANKPFAAGKDEATGSTALHSGVGPPPPAGAPPLTIAAQEVYRVLLFLVFYAEIWLLGQVPLIGMLAA
jgi:hypothetical protein